MSSPSLRVRSLTRFPVKSLLGEATSRLDLDHRGCVGDRVWSVRTADGGIGSGKTTRRFRAVPGLLELRAATDGDGVVTVRFPDGATCRVDDPRAAERLSAHVGRPLTFARERDVSHFDDGPVSLVGTASVEALAARRAEPVDVSRFRANIVLESTQPNVEDTWVGSDVRLGSAVLRVSLLSLRCVMVDAKTADLPAQPGNLRAIGRLNHAVLGVVATVVEPGTVSVGDVAVRL